jgi:hypothetical protein
MAFTVRCPSWLLQPYHPHIESQTVLTLGSVFFSMKPRPQLAVSKDIEPADSEADATDFESTPLNSALVNDQEANDPFDKPQIALVQRAELSSCSPPNGSPVPAYAEYGDLGHS